MRARRRQSGFTLFEILVVVFIIAIITSTAVVSLGVLRDDREVQREADRAVALFTILQDEAMLQGREFGIEFTLNGYRFVEYDIEGDRWADVPLDEFLRTRTLPDDMEFELYIDGQGIKLEQNVANFVADEDEESAFGLEQYAPHVFVFSSGDITPFELHFIRPLDETRIAFQVDLLGNTEYLELDEFY